MVLSVTTKGPIHQLWLNFQRPSEGTSIWYALGLLRYSFQDAFIRLPQISTPAPALVVLRVARRVRDLSIKGVKLRRILVVGNRMLVLDFNCQLTFPRKL